HCSGLQKLLDEVSLIRKSGHHSTKNINHDIIPILCRVLLIYPMFLWLVSKVFHPKNSYQFRDQTLET
ncbi:hypothetical protein L9F63_004623, partial [Diploptera punctata]